MPGPSAEGVRQSARSTALAALLDEQVEFLFREDPIRASTRGEAAYDRLLRDESPEAYAARRAEVASRLERLRRLEAAERAAWGEEDRTDADLLRFDLELAAAGAAFFPEQLGLDNKEGVQISLPQMADSLPFTSGRAYEDYAARLEGVPRVIDQVIAQMRAGLAAGRVQPRPAMAGTVEQCEAAAAGGDDPAASPFYRPFRTRPPGDAAAARARRAISAGIAPAYRRLGAFLRDEYIPRARETIAAAELPDGRAFYEWQLRRHTTTAMTAEAIHRTGMEEVARLRAEMFDAIARTDFARRDELSGDALFEAFVAYLRTDRRFYCDSAEELLSGYREIAKRIDAELPRLFGTLPRNTYGVREMPPIAAKMGPTAYYFPGSMKAGVPGYFVANTFRLDQRPRYEMICLTMHEAAPGHHLQIATAQELADDGRVHRYRTMLSFNAFVEGWALYAERLGLEMVGPGRGEGAGEGAGAGPSAATAGGLYADPYDNFGRLTYEMWRACRLVVDTGMHAMGWSRERAIAFMRANTALSDLNIEREVDRYIAWPGQACAYKIGELRIRELRREAESRLGPRFDLRKFHDCVLGAGAVPLPVLEARVRRWIEAQG